MEILLFIPRFIIWGIKELKMYLNPIDIKFYNHWGTFLTENLPHKMWFYRFIKHRQIPFQGTFFSTEGFRWFIKCFKGKKVFFTAEYLHEGNINKRWLSFSDHCLNEVNLAIGFDPIQNPKYIRFPLWMMHLVQPEMSFDDLQKRIDQINDPNWRLTPNRNQFAVQISNHDINGIRKHLISLLNQVEHVTCAGKFMNNTTDLKTTYNDDKWLYLKNFKFNICPENTSAKGYITEKILDSFVGGCIPIYWGGGKKEWIEENIFNPNAFLYYEEGKEEELLNQISKLWHNSQDYEKFIQIPPFKENAAKIIWQKITELQNKLETL